MGYYATEPLSLTADVFGRSRQANTDHRPKNRVGGSRTALATYTRRFPAQTLEPRQETVTLDSSKASGAGEWLSNDPIGISGGLNQYVFCANNPANFRDPFGLATYLQNRSLGGNEKRSNYNPVSHSFIFTTAPNGNLTHTYSWGNEGPYGTWHIDQPEDITAANQALKDTKGLRKKGCDDLDLYIDQAFQDWQYDLNHMHWNLGAANNCKIEARQMINEAIKRMNNPGYRGVGNDVRNYGAVDAANSFVGPAMNFFGLPY